MASLFGDATTIADGVIETVTCEQRPLFLFRTYLSSLSLTKKKHPAADAGAVFTIVTSQGGSAITLAESAAGQATSFAGHEFTVATGAVASATSVVSKNSAVGRPSSSLAPIVASFIMVVGGGLAVIFL